MQITFLGATGTVTGSKYLLSCDNMNILVDCGLFQGTEQLELRNWSPLPFNPTILDAVLLTHAHIDHTGYLPLLVKHGFRKSIYCTYGTRDLCELLLPDSAHLQEEDAKHLGKHHSFKKHAPKPLYTLADAEQALKLFKPQSYNTLINLHNAIRFQFLPAGHIIGASLIQIQHPDATIVFTGDLGRAHDPVMKQPAEIKLADYLIIESTYGDRLHAKESPKRVLENVINKTIRRGGSVIIPAFAVARSQSILHYLSELKKEQAIPDVPIYLDSPMAIKATQLIPNHMEDLRLSPSQCQELCTVASQVLDMEHSIDLDYDKTPKIIVSASGMASGGRILYHLRAYASDPRCTILFTGYQAQGTLGSEILAGRDSIEAHGKIIPINAQVEAIDSASAHADYDEILGWLHHFNSPPKRTFITHGEPEAARALKHKIETQLGWECSVPEYGQTEHLS